MRSAIFLASYGLAYVLTLNVIHFACTAEAGNPVLEEPRALL